MELPKPFEQFVPSASAVCCAVNSTNCAKIYFLLCFFLNPVHGNFIECCLVSVAGERIKNLFASHLLICNCIDLCSQFSLCSPPAELSQAI